MCVAWSSQQFRQSRKSETSIFVVLESSTKDVCFVDGNMKQNIQPIAVQENAWMWMKINYHKNSNKRPCFNKCPPPNLDLKNCLFFYNFW